MGLHLSNSARILTNGNAVILANVINGKWIRMPKEVYDIFSNAINDKMDISSLLEDLDDEEDRIFIDSLYNKLDKLEIIIEDSGIQEFPNKTISFEMTHRCNLKCIHCCIDADGVVSKKEDLSTDLVKVIFDKMIAWEPKNIMLSGGECMLRTDFKELLIYLREKYNGKIIVSTNGTLINEDNVNFLSKCADQIDISLDGVDEESCSIVRGKGVFNKVIQSVKLLQNIGYIRITLSMIISDKNEYLKEDFIKLNDKLGTKPILRIFSSIGRGQENEVEFTALSKNGVYISSDFFDEKNNSFLKVRNCSAGKRDLFVAYNGDIYPCPSFIKSQCFLGNILEIDSLCTSSKDNNVDIQRINKVEEVSLLNNEKCKNCNINLFCCTCPGALEPYSMEQFENYCNIVKPIISKRVWGVESHIGSH